MFALGAYPSALHVGWVPPGPWKPVKAIAVDNEPEPFWVGLDEQARIDMWKQQVVWNDLWGRVSPVSQLNGSSGTWLRDRVFCPLGIKREQTCISDCLDTYRMSLGVEKRLSETILPASQALGFHPPSLQSHPSEDQIVGESKAHHLTRLRLLLKAAKPQIVITLGNAALRVLLHLVDAPRSAPSTLACDRSKYGKTISVRLPDGSRAKWFPLAHPASPTPFQKTHDSWIEDHDPVT